MFEQEKDVGDFLFFAQGDQLLLQTKTGRIVNGAELDKRNQIRCRGFARIHTD